MENEKKSVSHFCSLSGKMLNYTIIPMIILAVLVGIVGSVSCRKAIESMIQEEMIKQCTYFEDTMNKLYPGDYSWKIISDDSFILYKGDYDITNQTETIDSLKCAFNNEFTIYLGQVSVFTTCEDDKGMRFVLAEAPTVVRTAVIENGETKFYSNVTVAGEKCFAYFRPIISEDGNSYGMYAIYHSAADINKRVRSVVIPLYVLCFVAVLALGFFSTYCSQKIVDRILAIKKFTESVADGKLNTEMRSSYTSGNDEIAALARTSVKMQRNLRKMVDYDALTEINNRRYANMYIKRMYNVAGDGLGYGIAIGDIDYFKKINDTYGHTAGDEVLKTVAGILRKNVPLGNLVARWGGEEFIFVFNNIKQEEAEKILEKSLVEIRETVIEYDRQEIKVTMSFGLAMAEPDKSIDKILKEADDLLYDAKAMGRDRIVAPDRGGVTCLQ